MENTLKEKIYNIPTWVKYSSTILVVAGICLGSTLPFVFKDSYSRGFAIDNNGYDKEEVSFLKNDIERSKTDNSVDLYYLGVSATYDVLQQAILMSNSILLGNEVYVYMSDDAIGRYPSLVEPYNSFDNFHCISDSTSANSKCDSSVPSSKNWNDDLVDSINRVDELTDKKINLYLNNYHYITKSSNSNWINEIDIYNIETINFLSDGRNDIELINDSIQDIDKNGFNPYAPSSDILSTNSFVKLTQQKNNLNLSDYKYISTYIPYVIDFDGDGERDIYNSVYVGQPFYDNIEKPNVFNSLGTGFDLAIQESKLILDNNGKSAYDYFIESFDIDDNTYDEAFFQGKNNLIYAGVFHPNDTSNTACMNEAKIVIDSYNNLEVEFPNRINSVVYKGHPALSSSQINQLESCVEQAWINDGGSTPSKDWFITVDPKLPFEIMMMIDEFQDDLSSNTTFLWSVTLSSTTTGAYWEMNRKQPYQYTFIEGENVPPLDYWINWFGRSSKVVDWDNVIQLEE